MNRFQETQFIEGAIYSGEPDADEIYDARDAARLIENVRTRLSGHARMLGVNAGERFETEADDLAWACRVVQEAFEVPVCFDSPSAEAQLAGLQAHDNRFGRPLINSMSLEEDRARAVLPMVNRFDADVVVLLHDEEGMPTTARDRLRVMPKLEALREKYDVPRDRVYLDAVVFPIAIDQNAICEYFMALERIRAEYPGYRTLCGLGNVSHGIPGRDQMDEAFVLLCALDGHDAVVHNVTEQQWVLLRALACLAGKDPYCQRWIGLKRAGLL